VSRRKHALDKNHLGATWRIWLKIHARRGCGLTSNYFDHLLLLQQGTETVKIALLWITPVSFP